MYDAQIALALGVIATVMVVNAIFDIWAAFVATKDDDD